MQTEPRYEVALKKALKDTMEITNSLYASYFEINQDEDVFDRLVQETNPKEDLDSADEKFKIASIVRQLKEADYKKAIALEKNGIKPHFVIKKDSLNLLNLTVMINLKKKLKELVN